MGKAAQRRHFTVDRRASYVQCMYSVYTRATEVVAGRPQRAEKCRYDLGAYVHALANAVVAR